MTADHELIEVMQANVEASKRLAEGIASRVTKHILWNSIAILAIVTLLSVGVGFVLARVLGVAHQNRANGRQIIECVVPISEDPQPDQSTPVNEGRCFERFAASRVASNQALTREIVCGAWKIGSLTLRSFGYPPLPPPDPEDIGPVPCRPLPGS